MDTIEQDRHKKKLGKKGERLAAKYLKRHGYQIVERNYVNPFGEIDIIAREGDTVAFIEVKTRLTDTFGAPSEAVTPAKRRRYIQGAKHYFYGRDIDCTVRFDVIEVFGTEINHIISAFEAR